MSFRWELYAEDLAYTILKRHSKDGICIADGYVVMGNYYELGLLRVLLYEFRNPSGVHLI